MEFFLSHCAGCRTIRLLRESRGINWIFPSNLGGFSLPHNDKQSRNDWQPQQGVPLLRLLAGCGMMAGQSHALCLMAPRAEVMLRSNLITLTSHSDCLHVVFVPLAPICSFSCLSLAFGSARRSWLIVLGRLSFNQVPAEKREIKISALVRFLEESGAIEKWRGKFFYEILFPFSCRSHFISLHLIYFFSWINLLCKKSMQILYFLKATKICSFDDSFWIIFCFVVNLSMRTTCHLHAPFSYSWTM